MIYMSVEKLKIIMQFDKLSFGFSNELLNVNTQNQFYKTLG
jgi:hypothetical protein